MSNGAESAVSTVGSVPEERVRDRILTAACDLFYREGIQAVGIQRVLGDAGAAKASLYDHFRSKDDLIAAYLEQRGAAWQSSVEHVVATSDVDATSRVLLIFDAVAAFIDAPDFRGCPFINAAAELSNARHPGRSAIAHHRGWLHRLIRRLLLEEMGDAPERLVGALVVLHDGALAAALVDRDRDAGRNARWAAAILLDMAAERQATKTPKRRSLRGTRRGNR
jgi:AcrR family transcriptional regulator